MPRIADFPRKIKYNLALAAHFRCVRPGCSQVTHAFDSQTNEFKNLGVAAHDVAASHFGPRADDTVSVEQKRAHSNGAWLCRDCAEIVDRLPERFPIGTISGWQKDANEALLNGMVQPIKAQHINLREACTSARLFCNRLRNVGLSGCSPYLGLSYRHIADIRSLLSECAHFGPTNMMFTMYTHTTNLQLQMLENLRAIVWEVTESQLWSGDNDWGLYRANGRGEAIQSAQKVWMLWHDYCKMHYKLSNFAATGQTPSNNLEGW